MHVGFPVTHVSEPSAPVHHAGAHRCIPVARLQPLRWRLRAKGTSFRSGTPPAASGSAATPAAPAVKRQSRAIKPKPPFAAVFSVAAARAGSGVELLPTACPEASEGRSPRLKGRGLIQICVSGGDGGESNYTANTGAQVSKVIWSLV